MREFYTPTVNITISKDLIQILLKEALCESSKTRILKWQGTGLTGSQVKKLRSYSYRIQTNGTFKPLSIRKIYISFHPNAQIFVYGVKGLKPFKLLNKWKARLNLRHAKVNLSVGRKFNKFLPGNNNCSSNISTMQQY